MGKKKKKELTDEQYWELRDSIEKLLEPFRHSDEATKR
jgi:hypothetical protein